MYGDGQKSGYKTQEIDKKIYLTLKEQFSHLKFCLGTAIHNSKCPKLLIKL